MKKYSIAFLFAAMCINVAIAQIPNNGFENWTNMGTYSNPDQWGTMNNVSTLGSIYTATQGTPGNPGSYYLKLTSKTTPLGVLNGIAVCGRIDSLTMKPKSGFACTQRPQNFVGKWQHMIFGTSQGGLTATLTKWNSGSGERDTIAIADQTLAGMHMSWAPFTIPFVYQSNDFPDSCIIFLRASGATPANQDYLWVDDLSFTGWVGIGENASSTENGLVVFPNPSNGTVIIDLNANSSAQTIIELADMNGNIVLTKNAGILNNPSKQTLDVSGLAKGTYLVNVISGKEKSVKKIIIQ